MRAHTHTTAPEPEGAVQSRAYGVPSPMLLALADRGFARFLEDAFEPEDDPADADGHDDADR